MDQQPTAPQTPPAGNGKGGKTAIIIIIILLLLGLGWYFTAGKKGSNQVASNSQNSGSQQPAQGTTAQPMSLKDLMAGGQQKCDVSFQNANSQSQGTIYVGGGKFRGDFSAQVNGKTEMSHMINDGTNVYTWMEGMKTGFKMSATATQTNNTAAPQQRSIDPDAKYDYHCNPGMADPSEFTPPSSVTFSDMSSMMQPTPTPGAATPNTGTSAQGAPSNADIHAQQCAACGSLTGESKTQCLAALKCN